MTGQKNPCFNYFKTTIDGSLSQRFVVHVEAYNRKAYQHYRDMIFQSVCMPVCEDGIRCERKGMTSCRGLSTMCEVVTVAIGTETGNAV
jgi:hypothetical protein